MTKTSPSPEVVQRRPEAQRTVVVAPGPSLPELQPSVWRAKQAGWFVIAVQDAHRLCPYADVLYGCDRKWWAYHKGVESFAGERWSTQGTSSNDHKDNPWKLRLVRGEGGKTFSTDPAVVHHGDNSGFQAVNLAILFGATLIALVGFDHHDTGPRHFFGGHPNGWGAGSFHGFIQNNWQPASQSMPDGVVIYNCTPGSALRCFEPRSLDDLCD